MTRKLTKQQRAERERELVAAIVSGLVAATEERAKHWSYRARDLRQGLSATAIKRAERMAHKIAEESPPGYVRAMEALDQYNEICDRLRIPAADQERLWEAMCQFCMFQLGAGEGPFYDAARYFGIAVPPDERKENVIFAGSEKIEVVAAPPRRRRTPGCNCPNCRPRTAEELN